MRSMLQRAVARGRSVTAILAAGVLIAAGLVGASAGSHRALADMAWCWDDPVVNIGGRLVSTQIGVLGDPVNVAKGVQKAIVVYTLPTGVGASVVSTSHQFFQEKVFFQTGPARWYPGAPIPVRVTVTFIAEGSLTTSVRNLEGTVLLSTSGGTTDSGMTATFTLN